MTSVYPIASITRPHAPARILGIVGCTGQLGGQVMPPLIDLAQRYGLELTLLCHDERSYARARLMLTDMAPAVAGVKVCMAHDSPALDVLVVCSGASTLGLTGADKKMQLLSRNRQHLAGVLSQSRFRVAVIATNPTTPLLATLQADFESMLVGIGVENDNLRYRAQLNAANGRVLVGAHLFEDLVDASTSSVGSSERRPDRFVREEYVSITTRQDRALEAKDFMALVELADSLPIHVRWWAQQRANSTLNRTCASAVRAVLNVVAAVANVGYTPEHPVVLETLLHVDGKPCVLGWPFDARTLAPTIVHFGASGLAKLSVLVDKYALGRKIS